MFNFLTAYIFPCTVDLTHLRFRGAHKRAKVLARTIVNWRVKVTAGIDLIVCLAMVARLNCGMFGLYSYAGLHCVVIKGYSKSAGYQPGVCFEDNRFRNSWNAVYVAGAWRFVQCNWGARHLVNAKEVPRPGQAKAKNDSLRYDQARQRETRDRPSRKLSPTPVGPRFSDV